MHLFFQKENFNPPGGSLPLSEGIAWALLEKDVREYEGVGESELPPAALVSYRSPRGPATALVAGMNQEVRVNGKRVLGRLHVLADRDRIEVGKRTFWFGTVSPPQVAPYAGASAAHCLCGDVIPVASPAVECGCGGLFHVECWESELSCPLCERPTDYDQPWPWTPEGLTP